ncbi:CBS domain-containing protein CBSX5-like [Andrographis paniculata]|uniref:CBS domain-containing protein CBSX5-like n=1 Tax=Andrographis paniculata TaxID=175694 RepID=UPI0021E8046F|nr:CBS domain-containing protein CBSX5-like [Andrographis paniculata]
MAVRLLYGEISDLCVGKPKLGWISASASISEALSALKASGDTQLSVWECTGESANGRWICVGKFSVADVILYLCREINLADPFKAFEAPVSDILPKAEFPIVRHLEADSSLLEAIECILEGTQNLVIPITNHRTTDARKKSFIRKKVLKCDCLNRHLHCCWLTQEDMVRYLLNSIGVFSPIPTLTVESLDAIDSDIITLPYYKAASSALAQFSRALAQQKPIAVVDDENRLIGEISPVALARCNITTAAAIMTLSVADLMAYIEYSEPPEDLVQLIKMRLEGKNLVGMMELMDEFFHTSKAPSSYSPCSSDDESLSSSIDISKNGGWGRHSSTTRWEVVVCGPGSSLVAVMFQALANQVPCVWVVEEDQTLVGAVTLAGILEALSNVAP